MVQFRNICFTLNNPTDEERAQFLGWITDDGICKHMRYIIFQEERGLGSDADGHVTPGNVHFQGYIEFKSVHRQRWIKKNINARMHFEMRHGSQAQACNYCCKEETRVRDGVRGEGGRRKRAGRMTEGSSLVEAIIEKCSIKEIADAFPEDIIKHPHGVEKLISLQQEPRRWLMNNIFYIGPTGSGKSWSAYTYDDEEDTYVTPMPAKGGWWCPNYWGQRTFVIDDWMPENKINKPTMMRITDRYPMSVQYKGGNREFESRNLIITSNFNPYLWYENEGMSRDHPNMQAWFRRLDEAKIYLFSAVEEWIGVLPKNRDKKYIDYHRVQWNWQRNDWEDYDGIESESEDIDTDEELE